MFCNIRENSGTKKNATCGMAVWRKVGTREIVQNKPVFEFCDGGASPGIFMPNGWERRWITWALREESMSGCHFTICKLIIYILEDVFWGVGLTFQFGINNIWRKYFWLRISCYKCSTLQTRHCPVDWSKSLRRLVLSITVHWYVCLTW